METNPLSLLSERIFHHAHSLKMEIIEHPDILSHRRSFAEEFANSLLSETARSNIEPGETISGRSYFIDKTYALRIISINDTIDQQEIDRVLDSIHTQLAVDRGYIPVSGRDDLFVFVIGPEGTDIDPRWRSIAERIESDEQICRKMVWLPPSDRHARATDADAFLRRTFLGRPWKSAENSTGPIELDPIERILQAHHLSDIPIVSRSFLLRDLLTLAIQTEDIDKLADLLLSTTERSAYR